MPTCTLALRTLVIFWLLVVPTALQAQTWQWATGLTGSNIGSSVVYATALDGNGNTVVAGKFSGTVTFGTTTLTSLGNTDVFVGRLNSMGQWTQAVQAGGIREDYPVALALNTAGVATVLGKFYSTTAQFGTTTLTNASSNDEADVFVAQLSSIGTWSRAVRGGGEKSEFPSALALDAAGNVLITGYFFGPSSSFGTTTLINADLTSTKADIFVARLDNFGTWSQAVRAGGPDDDRAEALAIDASGVAVIGGSFDSPTISFGTTTLTNANTSGTSPDAFVARLNANGTWGQAIRAGGAAEDQIDDLTLDRNGNTVVVGYFRGPAIALGATTLANAAPASNTLDIFVAQLNAAGVWTQAVQAGGTGNDRASSLALASNGSITITGLFSGTSRFGPYTLTNADPTGVTADVVVARLSSTSSWLQAVRAGGPANDLVFTSALASNGDVTVGGYFTDASTTFGTTTLLASDTNGSAFVARLTNLTLAAKQPSTTETIRLAPNPTYTTATFTLPAQTVPRAVLLLDALGREVRHYTLPTRATSTTVDVIGLAPGMYIVRCGADKGRLLVE